MFSRKLEVSGKYLGFDILPLKNNPGDILEILS